MATYHYRCKNPKCGHDFEAIQQSPKNPQKVCPKCKETTLEIVIDSAPMVKEKWGLIRGGKNAPIYRDFNKKYKKAARHVNRALGTEV